MNKIKHKEQPYNTRRYWLFFSVLAMLLLIPFRIVGYWMLTDLIYISISVLVLIALIRFVRRYSWRKWVVGLMLICLILPISHLLSTDAYRVCEVLESNILIEHIHCINSCSGISRDFIVIRNTRFGIEKVHPIMAYLVVVNPQCIEVNGGLR